jgi:hypothetical protein
VAQPTVELPSGVIGDVVLAARGIVLPSRAALGGTTAVLYTAALADEKHVEDMRAQLQTGRAELKNAAVQHADALASLRTEPRLLQQHAESAAKQHLLEMTRFCGHHLSCEGGGADHVQIQSALHAGISATARHRCRATSSA